MKKIVINLEEEDRYMTVWILTEQIDLEDYIHEYKKKEAE